MVRPPWRVVRYRRLEGTIAVLGGLDEVQPSSSSPSRELQRKRRNGSGQLSGRLGLRLPEPASGKMAPA